MKTTAENVPTEEGIARGDVIELQTRFGSHSRGRCWGRYYPNRSRATGDWRWVEKQRGTLFLEGPGYYVVGSHDGFQRKAKAEFYLPLDNFED